MVLSARLKINFFVSPPHWPVNPPFELCNAFFPEIKILPASAVAFVRKLVAPFILNILNSIHRAMLAEYADWQPAILKRLLAVFVQYFFYLLVIFQCPFYLLS